MVRLTLGHSFHASGFKQYIAKNLKLKKIEREQMNAYTTNKETGEGTYLFKQAQASENSLAPMRHLSTRTVPAGSPPQQWD